MLWTVSDKELPGGCRPTSRVVGYNSGLILAQALFLFPEHCDVAGHLSLTLTQPQAFFSHCSAFLALFKLSAQIIIPYTASA